MTGVQTCALPIYRDDLEDLGMGMMDLGMRLWDVGMGLWNLGMASLELGMGWLDIAGSSKIIEHH